MVELEGPSDGLAGLGLAGFGGVTLVVPQPETDRRLH